MCVPTIALSPGSNSITLTLVGDGSVSPGETIGNLRAEVTCNGTPVPAQVILEVEAERNSGGHLHHVNRPPGLLIPASGMSPAIFPFTAPAPSGDHAIKARCVDDSCGTATARVWVGVKGLKWQASSANYVLLPNRDTNHPGNHYVTANTERNVPNLASAYHRSFPNDPVLHFNDASLERGGLFDIGSD